MVIHNLKLRDEYVDDVMFKIKTFELRKNDRDYKVGDYIHFIKIDGSEFGFSYPTDESGTVCWRDDNLPNNLFKITYILENVPEYGLEKGYCILGIKRVHIQEEVE